MKIGDKVIITSFSNFEGIVDQIFDDGMVLVDMKGAFQKHVDARSILKLCVPESELKPISEWASLWDQGSDE